MQTKHKYFLIAYRAPDYNEKLQWAQRIIQLHPEFTFSIIYNANKEPDNGFYNSDKINTIFYPSNRIIEPHYLLIQLLNQDKVINYLFSIPDGPLDQLQLVPSSSFDLIHLNGNCIGIKLKQTVIFKRLKKNLNFINNIRTELLSLSQ